MSDNAARVPTITATVHRLGDDISTDMHCSAKYNVGKSLDWLAQHAFEQVVPGFAQRVRPGDVIVAGRDFGINSSREQAVHVLRELGVAAVVARSFGRQFYRNAINNGLAIAECAVEMIEDGDTIEVDLAGGRVAVAARGWSATVPKLPPAVLALIAAGGLLPYLKQHPDWGLPAG
ncbi:MAG: 3-isopropylmalate dehydratase [Proteobacteria bacterium]|nr:3-isopropylmalate dehydratase [Burkholderiales bacterium]